MVRLQDGLLVVLHHEDRVAQVAQPLEGREQPGVVPLVEADGGLVEDVEDPHEGRADLGGEPDPLPLAAGEGAGGPVQGEVVEPHVDEEGEPFADLLEDPAGDLLLLGGQSEGAEEGQGVGDGQGRHVADVPSPHGDEERLLFQPRPVAGGAGHDVHVLFQLLPDLLRSVSR